MGHSFKRLAFIKAVLYNDSFMAPIIFIKIDWISAFSVLVKKQPEEHIYNF